MKRVLIFGNSASGKSTLAKELSQRDGLKHLDLDVLAWEDDAPPRRRSLQDSAAVIEQFIHAYPQWVIEGCYADLLELALPFATEIIFLDLPDEACIENARQRPWEPHKYHSKEEQDENLQMLLGWISEYSTRDDVFSRSAHRRLYDSFSGKKTLYVSNRRS